MKNQFIKRSYERLKFALTTIPQTKIDDIYVLSLFYWCEDDDMRFPMITIGYNTLNHYKKQKNKASNAEEAKWNSAFWLLNDLGRIGGKKDEYLSQWFEKTPYYFSQQQLKNSIKNDELYEQLLDKGEQFNDEFMEVIVDLGKRLFAEKCIERTFGRNIPIVIHNFEEYHWTKEVNPPKLLNEFLSYYGSDDLETKNI